MDSHPATGHVSRRTALKALAAGGTGLILGGSEIVASAAESPTRDADEARTDVGRKLGVALVGLGGYSTAMLGPSLRETQWCELRGIVSGTAEKRERWAADFNLPKTSVYDYEHFDAIADNPDIEIVYVVLPNFLHAEYTIRAARAGKHVICEKPMAMNPDECRRMIAACRDAGRQLSLGYRLHFDPFHQEAMRLGKEKTFGSIKIVEASLGFDYPNPESWRFKAAEGGGGAIMDLGVYCVQAGRYVTGENPIEVSAHAYTFETDRFVEIPETYFFQMRFPGGTVSTHAVTYSSYVDRLYACGSEGHRWLELEPSFQGGPNAPVGRTREGPMDFAHVNQTTAQMDAFARCIIDQRPTTVPGEEGLIDMTIIKAIKQAARTGTTVPVTYA